MRISEHLQNVWNPPPVRKFSGSYRLLQPPTASYRLGKTRVPCSQLRQIAPMSAPAPASRTNPGQSEINPTIPSCENFSTNQTRKIQTPHRHETPIAATCLSTHCR